jgi:hypothetical protein
MFGFKSLVLLNSTATVVCREDIYGVPSTSVTEASGWAVVDTWPLTQGGCCHVTDVRGQKG